MKDKEIWKDIPDYKGLYQVSNQGNIRSLDREIMMPNGGYKRVGGNLKSQCFNLNGYLRVLLSKDGLHKQCPVHRLVLITFVGEKLGLQVNHKNGIKTDNRLENLEWMTPSENMIHASKNGFLNPYTRPILDLNTNTLYNSIKDLSSKLGIKKQTIYMGIYKNTKKYSNFKYV